MFKNKKYLEEKFNGLFISEPDQGISDAFNKGIKLATGKGIVFLNSGDLLIDRNYLKIANQLLEKYEYIYSDIYFLDSLAGKIRLRPTFKPLGRGMPYPHQTLIVRREIFDRIGTFSLEYKLAMDFDFACRLEKKLLRGLYYEKATVLMEGNGVSSQQEDKLLQECRTVLKKQNLYNLINYFEFQKRKILFLIRKILFTLKLTSLLILLKKIKNH
ncbi:hypothetical protein [Picosynechococcus sp. NKBG042902]|uniref:hypothetical protein n=1 Tax=Picosynechococcus sp. NKBG042902 TaxID=490193 RepID=UPI0004AAA083|nr:hypothetical protein [Picosynechococcus sp. NKBG042902]